MKISKNDLKRVKKLDLLSYYKNYDPNELIPMQMELLEQKLIVH